jgi:hypothetical protein
MTISILILLNIELIGHINSERDGAGKSEGVV